ncbi:hypothetical protein [uncultured Corynebacterium sp.]|uniref:hypothetical protein n=1 Tax=uncultured Corynebacterium sp. TaxID=159447 RepID=UPI002611D48B|nr:hypothetical protein [uncultured Corynebacterium sp.]
MFGKKQKYSEADLEFDPLLRLERRHKSSVAAVVWGFATPILTILTGLLVAVIGRASGGPLCEAGLATWLCTRWSEIAICVVPLAVAFGGLIGAGINCYIKFKTYNRWWPWLAVMWVLLPFSLGWMTSFGTIAIIGRG